MNIKEHVQALKAERGDFSYAFLAERTDTTPDSPYRIKPAEPIRPDETTVLVLAGSGGYGDNIRGHNGYLKRTDDFVKNHPELQDKSIRVCVAVCNFGKYHDDRYARYLENWRHVNHKHYQKGINGLVGLERQEILEPKYIQDIFDAAVLPRISTNNGQNRLPQAEAISNIRKLNLVTHCHGAYVAIQLENLMTAKMMELGYNNEEQTQIKNHLVSLNYAPNCASSLWSNTYFVSIESAMDGHNDLKTYLKEYLHMAHKDFGVCYMPKQENRTFMCAQIDKVGIEGNPPRQYILREINEDFLAEIASAHADNELKDYQEPEEDNRIGEHIFIGFEPKEWMSKGAMKMQRFANNILKNSLKNSLKQTPKNYIHLPKIQNLCADNLSDKCEFAKAAIIGFRLQTQMKCVSKEKLDSHALARRSSYISLD